MYTWRLFLNVNKRSVLTLTLKKMPFKFDYSLGDIILNRVAVQKDLGIFIESRLTFVRKPISANNFFSSNPLLRIHNPLLRIHNPLLRIHNPLLRIHTLLIDA